MFGWPWVTRDGRKQAAQNDLKAKELREQLKYAVEWDEPIIKSRMLLDLISFALEIAYMRKNPLPEGFREFQEKRGLYPDNEAALDFVKLFPAETTDWFDKHVTPLPEGFKMLLLHGRFKYKLRWEMFQDPVY